MAGEDTGKQSSAQCWWKCTLAITDISLVVLPKAKNRAVISSSDTTAGKMLQDSKSAHNGDTCAAMFTVALLP
jgi:hypothetical protein